jgi:hypothetical protein
MKVENKSPNKYRNDEGGWGGSEQPAAGGWGQKTPNRNDNPSESWGNTAANDNWNVQGDDNYGNRDSPARS